MRPARTGFACKRETVDGIVNVSVNDRVVAFIDPSGKLSVGRENGQSPIALSKDGDVAEAAWSPDGAYLPMSRWIRPAGTAAGGEQALTTQLRIVEPRASGQ